MKNAPAKKIILMADDDADDRLLARDALEESRSDKDLRCVENGEELLDYLQHRGKYRDKTAPRPSLILLDLNMPLKDGREALREIRADPELRHIPVVIFTTSKADTDVGLLYELGANSFISKPFQFDALVGTMRLIDQYWFSSVELPK